MFSVAGAGAGGGDAGGFALDCADEGSGGCADGERGAGDAVEFVGSGGGGESATGGVGAGGLQAAVCGAGADHDGGFSEGAAGVECDGDRGG